jgi:hypothetical protein
VLVVLTVIGMLIVSASPGTSATDLEPLIYGWEQFFTLDWQPGERKGKPIVHGRISNTWGMPATNIRLLVEAFDGAGRPVAQNVEWLGTQLGPGVRAYFEVPAPANAPTYRVRVFAFDWVQAGNGSDRN